ncbi:MAG: hypothetical protein QXR60_04400, partial [Candidatus Nanoarchaeia archaeon]
MAAGADTWVRPTTLNYNTYVINNVSVSDFLNKSGDTMQGNLNMGGYDILSVGSLYAFNLFGLLDWTNITNSPTLLSYFTNDAGFITLAGVTWQNLSGVIPQVSFFGNDAGYVTLASITWQNLSGTPPPVSTFANDAGYFNSTGSAYL